MKVKSTAKYNTLTLQLRFEILPFLMLKFDYPTMTWSYLRIALIIEKFLEYYIEKKNISLHLHS